MTATLQSLPGVLVQSLMHMLPFSEILRFARSCHRLLTCAQDSFAWRHCPPLQLAFPANPIPPSNCRLLPRLKIHLTWSAFDCDSVDIARLLSLSSAARVTNLRMMVRTPLSDADERLLFAPGHWLHLRCLRVFRSSRSLVPHLASLPLLCHLELNGPVSDFAPLRSAASLTSLAATDRIAWSRGCSPSMLQIAQLPLRKLIVDTPHLVADNFLAFCSSPAMAELEELALSVWLLCEPADAISPVDLQTGLACLVSLRTLRLIDSDPKLAALISHLHALPRLTLLTLTNSPPSWDELILQLLQRAEQLRVEMTDSYGHVLEHSNLTLAERVSVLRSGLPDASNRIALLPIPDKRALPDSFAAAVH